MKLQNKFTMARPINEVWGFFHDIDAVAECLPGASYEGVDDAGRHKGNMSMKIGPFQSKFEGAADVTYDDDAKVVNMVGQGVDKRGGSRGKMTMDCRLVEAGGQTEVTVESNIQMSGAIAQFGRPGIVEEIAKVLISDFVTNAQDRMGSDNDMAVEPAVMSEAPATAGTPAMTAGATPAAQPSSQPKPARKPAQSASSVSAGSILWRSLLGWLKSLFRK